MKNRLTNKDIGHLLNLSANQLDRDIANSLYVARQQALQRQRASTPIWTNQNGLLHGHLRLSPRALNWVIAAVVVSLLAINLSYWNRMVERDHSDIDIAILTDDLPVDMYVDTTNTD